MNSLALVVGYATLAAIAGGFLFLAYLFADEAHRSYRQTRRIERIALGKGKRAPWRKFFARWRSDFLDTYSTLSIGGIELPYDSRKPVRRVPLG